MQSRRVSSEMPKLVLAVVTLRPPLSALWVLARGQSGPYGFVQSIRTSSRDQIDQFTCTGAGLAISKQLNCFHAGVVISPSPNAAATHSGSSVFGGRPVRFASPKSSLVASAQTLLDMRKQKKPLNSKGKVTKQQNGKKRTGIEIQRKSNEKD